ncbi:hypothetical protein AVEN_130014-1 [Araneus ventricosus]|uniref:Uncharacterized protein n=1 Tax=Araneus ventricosus TaxID=182803 RepID=A0A4Y2UT38_ARAVE|nr:hypothetical protein AVEN_130014-1 [Araneus ventricosus]
MAQEHHHLKIAEKLAIPHHIRHAYDYPQLNLGAQPARPAVNQGAGFRSPGFSQPDPFNQPQTAPTSFSRQPLSPVSSGPSQPVRQTRFFNLYTPGSRPDFTLSRRES